MRRRSPGSASTWLRCCSSATSCAGWGNIPGGRCSPSAWARWRPSARCSNSGSRCRCPRARSNASSGWADLDEIQALMHGFGVAMTPTNIALMFTGVILGVIIGVLPGLGGANGVAILLPLTFGMAQQPGGAASAIILLSCIYWGALFGGAITSILFNIPGEPWSVATTFDGYPLAPQGRAGSGQFRARVRAAGVLLRLPAHVLRFRRHEQGAALQDPRGDDDRLRAGRGRHRPGHRHAAAHVRLDVPA